MDPPGSPAARAATDAVPTRAEGAALLAALVALQYLRAPQVLLGGRIWGEEGSYLQAALERSAASALVWCSDAVGYYVLPLNLAAVAAARLPLVAAPLVFSGAGALVLALPLALAALDPEWRTRRRLGLAALVLLLCAPGAEIWLNLASAQFVIALGAAIALATSPDTRAAQALRLAYLGFAGLSGVASLLLAPLFALRALLDRSRARAAEAAVLFACLALQLALLAGAPEAGSRHRLGGLPLLAGIAASRQLLQLAVYPLDAFAGFGRVGLAAEILRAVQQPGLQWLALALAAGAFPLALLWSAHRSGARAAPWWIASAALLLLGSLVATRDPIPNLIHPVFASRYFYAPNALLLLALAECLLRARGPLARRAAAGALAWLLACGLLDFWRPEPFFFGRSDWYAEVRAWQADPTRPIAHAPTGWQIRGPVRPSLPRSGERP